MHITLLDGEQIEIRPLRPEDRSALEAGLAETSEHSRFLRFMRTVDHLSNAELDYLVNVDGVDHVAFAAATEDGKGLGIARYIRDKDHPHLAEAAVLVVDAHHGRGIGKELLRVLADHAVTNGITAFVAYVLAENRTVIEALASAGAVVEPDETGTKMVVGLPIDPALFEESALRAALRQAAKGEYGLR